MSVAEIIEPDVVSGLADRSWMAYANCQGRTHLFFAKKAERPQARERREAKAAKLCAICVVQAQCQQYARVNREYGYWGGESEEWECQVGLAPLCSRVLAPPVERRWRVERSR